MTLHQQFVLAAMQSIIAHHGIGAAGLTPNEVASFADDYALAALEVCAEPEVAAE